MPLPLPMGDLILISHLKLNFLASLPAWHGHLDQNSLSLSAWQHWPSFAKWCENVGQQLWKSSLLSWASVASSRQGTVLDENWFQSHIIDFGCFCEIGCWLEQLGWYLISGCCNFFNGRHYVHALCHSSGNQEKAVHMSQLEKIWQRIHGCEMPPKSLERILSIGLNSSIEDPHSSNDDHKKSKKQRSQRILKREI